MTEAQATAAAFDCPIPWHDIDWAKATKIVGRLQARIVKAVKSGAWRRVKALQRLLTNSFSGKAIAVRRVTENRGKRTPGVDGQTWKTPEAKTKAMKKLGKIGYKPKPLRRVYIPKANGKQRPLGIPTMRDRAMQALHLLALEPVAETTADPNSYGFRRKRAAQDAAEQIFICLARKSSAVWVLDADIAGCFDNISHEWMLNNIPMDKVILGKWLRAGYMEGKKLFPTERGTPQGGIISPTLANIVLNGMEAVLKEEFGKAPRNAPTNQVHLIRYADDFVITGRTKEILERAREVIGEFLRKRDLSFSQEKTHITHIDEGFNFLGWNARKYGGKLLIKPAKGSLKKHLRTISETVTKLNMAKQETVVNTLNPIIKGWANYHASRVAKETFNMAKTRTWEKLWKWARRRHPNKMANWVKERYYHRHGGREWQFGVKATQSEEKTVFLYNQADTPIKRHIKVKGMANPFDPEWEAYFEERESKAVKATKGQRVLGLWLRQKGKCQVCQQGIEAEQETAIHHKQPKMLGGGDNLSNLQLLHGNCHRQLHASKRF